MNPKSWRDKVDRSYELLVALGNGIKVVEAMRNNQRAKKMSTSCVV